MLKNIYAYIHLCICMYTYREDVSPKYTISWEIGGYKSKDNSIFSSWRPYFRNNPIVHLKQNIPSQFPARHCASVQPKGQISSQQSRITKYIIFKLNSFFFLFPWEITHSAVKYVTFAFPIFMKQFGSLCNFFLMHTFLAGSKSIKMHFQSLFMSVSLRCSI